MNFQSLSLGKCWKLFDPDLKYTLAIFHDNIVLQVEVECCYFIADL